jgi:exodeoxyribonuclease VII large subunit
LVTSATGAAIRDVLHVVKRRNPGLEIVLVPCRVQGVGAAEEIAGAIRLLNEFNGGIGLILVTRGGGSLEDLWAFNEEVVARAIFESVLPVVSAVGHEIDFTISDFVADVRAATPSAAAEIITEGVFSSCQFVSEAAGRMGQLARQQMADKQNVLEQVTQRHGRMHPRRRFSDWLQRLDDLQSGLSRFVKHGARQSRLSWRNLAERLSRVRPGLLLKQRREVFQQAEQRLHKQTHHRLREWRNRLVTLDARLRLLGPEQVLSRGYSITMDAESGRVLRVAKQVKAGQRLRTRLSVGEVVSKIER